MSEGTPTPHVYGDDITHPPGSYSVPTVSGYVEEEEARGAQVSRPMLSLSGAERRRGGTSRVRASDTDARFAPDDQTVYSG